MRQWPKIGNRKPNNCLVKYNQWSVHLSLSLSTQVLKLVDISSLLTMAMQMREGDEAGNKQQQQDHDVEKGRQDKPEAPSGEAVDKAAYLVKWDQDDPGNPNNFSPGYKAWMTMQMALLAFVGSFGASVPSPAEPVIAAYFNVSLEATVLIVSLFVLGYAFGPMLWAPIAEVYGRKISMLPAVFVMGLFSIGTATSKTAAAIFVTRFFGGLFASAPISNVSAAIGDFYGPKERGVPMALMAMCVVGGPCVAPIVGAAITVNPHLGWRCKLVFVRTTKAGMSPLTFP